MQIQTAFVRQRKVEIFVATSQIQSNFGTSGTGLGTDASQYIFGFFGNETSRCISVDTSLRMLYARGGSSST